MQNKQTNAIVTGTRQQLCQVYEVEKALCRGTLFPELDKPLACVRNTCNPCATREQQCDFAAWELRLYLNMNPCDQQALDMYNRCCKALNGRGYACVNGCGEVQACCTEHAKPARSAKDCCDNDISFSRALRGDKDGFVRVNNQRAEKDAFVRVGSALADRDCCAAPTEEEPCCDHHASRWAWVDEPWPWENTAAHRKEG